jgi:hypothetical protein
MASKSPNMSTQGIVDKRKHITLMILQKHEIIRRVTTGKMKGCYGFIQHYISYLYYKETEGTLTILYGIK